MKLKNQEILSHEGGRNQMAIFKRKVRSVNGKVTEYWYVEIALPGGKKIKRSVGRIGQITKTVARQYENELKKKLRLGQLDMIQADIPTLNEIKNDYLSYVRDVKNKRSWKRDEELLKPLCKIFGSKKLSDISTKDIEDFKLLRIQEVSPATVNRSLSVLRHLLNLAKRWKMFFGENPVSIVGMLEENNLVERILSLEEENRLIESTIGYLRPVIITALNTGMRRGEILGLKWVDVDFQANFITINQSNSKSKKQRKVFINSTLRKMLMEIKLKSGNSEYVFLNDQGRNIKTIRTAYEGARRRAGLKDVRFHDFRHTVATRMVESCGNIVAVNKILGHSDIKTTMRYVHPDVSLKESLESLSNFGQNATNIATNEFAKNSNAT